MIHTTSAVILASGAGTRLKHLTATTPKPMLPFNNKPFLGYLLDWLQKSGIHDIVVTTHTEAEQIKSFTTTHFPTVHTVHEPSLTSTVQSAQYGLREVAHATTFIITADSIWDVDLEAMWRQHTASEALVTALVTSAAGVPNEGKVRVANDSTEIHRMWSNNDPPPLLGTQPASTVGVYLAQTQHLITAIHASDTSIEREPMQRLLPRVYAYWHHGLYLDYGTPDNYAYLQKHPELLTTYMKTS